LLPGTGLTFSAVTNKVWSSADGLTWTVSTPAVATDRWSIRERINAVVFKDKLWVIGGSAYPGFGNTNSLGTAYNDVWNTENGETWTNITTAAQFPPRKDPAVIVYKEKIWVFGGIDNGNVHLNDIWNSADGITWTKVTQVNAMPIRRGHQVIVHRNQLLLIGGETRISPTEVTAQNDLWVSEDDGVNWTKVIEGDPRALPAQFPTRMNFNAFVNNNVIWVLGGTSRSATNTYSIVNEIWKGGLN
jgi:N-acetylneuraminic acid mutarotase